MNRYPLWRYLLIIAVFVTGIIYALPNIYGEDPALQVTEARAGTIEPAFVETVTGALDKAGIEDLPDRVDGEDVSDVWHGAHRARSKPLYWRASSTGAAPAMREALERCSRYSTRSKS